MAFSQLRHCGYGPERQVVGDDAGSNKGALEIACDGDIEGCFSVECCDSGASDSRLLSAECSERRIGLPLPSSGRVPFRFAVADQ